MEGRALAQRRYRLSATASSTRRHHPAGRVKVYNPIVNSPGKGDGGARLRRPDSATPECSLACLSTWCLTAKLQH